MTVSVGLANSRSIFRGSYQTKYSFSAQLRDRKPTRIRFENIPDIPTARRMKNALALREGGGLIVVGSAKIGHTTKEEESKFSAGNTALGVVAELFGSQGAAGRNMFVKRSQHSIHLNFDTEYELVLIDETGAVDLKEVGITSRLLDK